MNVEILSDSPLETSEDGQTVVSLRVKLSSSPTKDVRVLIRSSDLTEGILSREAIRFLPQDRLDPNDPLQDSWKEGVNVTVIGQSDDVVS